MIRTTGLTKDFTAKSGTVHAVRGIDLEVAPGELVAVLGPNGAGKTTTIRMLTTLTAPTSGTAQVAGADIAREPGTVRRRIGYVGQGNGAGHAQRAVDELVVQGVVYGLDRRDARRRAAELMTQLDLDGLATRKVSDLSGGQRRRLDVALGLVHAPRLLFLDEPSTGLDPHNRANLWEHVLRLRQEHDMTVLLTTHYLDEADAMAERVVVVDDGRVIADDTATALKHTLAGDRVRLAAADPADLPVLAAVVGGVPGARDVAVAGDEVEARVADAPTALPVALAEAAARGVRVVRAEGRQPTLDDVFLSLTGRSLREEGAARAEAPETAEVAA
ncbi:ATP-binding cassette domain-containing protein [Cellulomonas triticagri]|uniref:ATP-binding cassette domain-containing protein n=1 Tax=Cellulomonas triticagri TaxID=2483352 RepID=A0A3M2JQ05_9CELL|nr:ATP-binding cassette domain-containing protein [Cellulomonas triticagri]RMI12805.1 ATP-binding cassette domain-containing protein [Cellulomonas triticagri]